MGLIDHFPHEFHGFEQNSLEKHVRSLKAEEMERLIGSHLQQLPDHAELRPILDHAIKQADSTTSNRLEVIQQYLVRVWSEGKEAREANHLSRLASYSSAMPDNRRSSVEKESSAKSTSSPKSASRVTLDLRPLFEAISKNDLAALQLLVTANPKYLQARMVLLPDGSLNPQGVLSKNERGCSALELAASLKNHLLVRYLVGEGGDFKDVEKGLFQPKEGDKTPMDQGEKRARLIETLKILYSELSDDSSLIDLLEKLFTDDIKQKGQLATVGVLEFLKKLTPSAIKELSEIAKRIDIKSFTEGAVKLNVPVWLRLIRESGVGMMHYLPYFERLQSVDNFEKITSKQIRFNHFTNQYTEWIQAISEPSVRESYQAVLEAHSRLMETFAFYEIPVRTFHAALDFLKDNPPKTTDRLPQVVLSSGNYHMVKLPPGDYRGLILGKIIDCCQSIDGQSAACVQDGMTKSDCGFYVLIKSETDKFDPSTIDWQSLDLQSKVKPTVDVTQAGSSSTGVRAEIIGQTYAWLSQEGGLVFDSWEEHVRPGAPLMGAFLLPQFATQLYLQMPTLTNVTIGVGGKTPEFLALRSIDKPQTMPNGYFMYHDALHQSEILSPKGALFYALLSEDNSVTATFKSLLENASEDFLKAALTISIALGKDEFKEYILSKLQWSSDTLESFLVSLHVDKIDSAQVENLNEALIYAVSMGNESRALKLLESGADINAKGVNAQALFKMIVYADMDKLLKEIVRHNPKEAAKAMVATASFINVKMMEVFLDGGIDVNAVELKVDIKKRTKVSPKMTTALLEACSNQNYEVIKLLLARGATDHHTALYRSGHCSALTMFGYLRDVVGLKVLVEGGLNVDTPSPRVGITALHAAVLSGSKEAVDYLLSFGANKDATSNRGDTPLMLLVRNEERYDGELFEKLVLAGSDVNKRNNAGETVLTLALGAGLYYEAAFLLRNGATVEASGGLDHLRSLASSNAEFLKFLEWHAKK